MTTTIKLKVHEVIGQLIVRIEEHRMAMTHASRLVAVGAKAINTPIPCADDYWYCHMSGFYPWNQLKGVLTLSEELYGNELTLDVEVVSELFKEV